MIWSALLPVQVKLSSHICVIATDHNYLSFIPISSIHLKVVEFVFTIIDSEYKDPADPAAYCYTT